MNNKADIEIIKEYEFELNKINLNLDRIKLSLKNKHYSGDEELEGIEATLKLFDAELNQISNRIIEANNGVPSRDPDSPTEKDFRKLMDESSSLSIRINNIKADILCAKSKPIPRSDNLSCTNAFIMRDALQYLGFYVEIADYEAPGRSRYGNYNPAPVLLTNATKEEILKLWPDYYDDDFDDDDYREKYEPACWNFDRYADGWVPPLPGSADTSPDTQHYWFPTVGAYTDDAWILVKLNQTPKYNSNKVLCFYSKGEYPQFSNFYLAKIEDKEYWYRNGKQEIETKEYASVEHYFQVMKALEFDPEGEVLKQMGNHLTCAEIKSLGRKVPNFDAGEWNIRRRFHMRDAVAMKFWQNEELKELLLSTGDAILAEASPRDTFWGIGYSGSNPKAHIPSEWRGRNVLGNMLMDLRDKLRNDKEEVDNEYSV